MLPFPRMLAYGNIIPPVTTGYIGVINDADFSYEAILNRLTPSGSIVSKEPTFKSFKFKLDNRVIIVPSQPIAIASYKEVYEKGMVWGLNGTGPDIFDISSGVSLTLQNATITIQGELYYIRLMKGTPLSTLASTVIDNPGYYNPMTEWELFIYSIWSSLPASYQRGYIVPEPDKIPKITVGSSTRRWALCQGSDGNRTSPRSIGRGRFEFTSTTGYAVSQVCTSSLSPLWTESQNLWWPVFEKV